MVQDGPKVPADQCRIDQANVQISSDISSNLLLDRIIDGKIEANELNVSFCVVWWAIGLHVWINGLS